MGKNQRHLIWSLSLKKEELSEQTQVCVLGVKGWSPALHGGLQATHTGLGHWWERAAPPITPQDMEASVSGSARAQLSKQEGWTFPKVSKGAVVVLLTQDGTLYLEEARAISSHPWISWVVTILSSAP